MSGIGIITNPHSKLNKRNPYKPAFLGYVLGEQGRLEITKSLSELPLVAEKFKQNNIEVLAINGGDGTVARTLTAFIQTYGDTPLPKVALLRGGTMNVLAQNLGVRGSPENILYRLVERYSSGVELPTTYLRTIEVEGNYGFLYADGVACSVLEEFYRKKSGAIGASLLICRIFFSALFNRRLAKRLLTSRRVRLTYQEDQTKELESTGVFAATISRMPLGPKLFPDVKHDDSNLQFFAVKSPPERLTRDLVKILWQTKIGESETKFNATTAELEIIGDKRYTYTLDGELFYSQSETLKLRLGPTIAFVR